MTKREALVFPPSSPIPQGDGDSATVAMGPAVGPDACDTSGVPAQSTSGIAGTGRESVRNAFGSMNDARSSHRYIIHLKHAPRWLMGVSYQS